MSISKWMDQKSRIHLHSGIVVTKRKKELLPFVDRTREHYTKWNKPDSERQIPFDFTFKWNLINKANKWAKYNQRHWNKKQADSNQTGGGREIMGKEREGSSRNTYKGPMDKAKGRKDWGWEVEVGWVGWGKVVVR